MPPQPPRRPTAAHVLMRSKQKAPPPAPAAVGARSKVTTRPGSGLLDVAPDPRQRAAVANHPLNRGYGRL